MFTRPSVTRHLTQLNKNTISDSHEFFEVIKSGDIEKCRQFFFDQNIKFWEIKNENDYTALHFSVFQNNYELTLLILEEVKKGLGINSSKKLLDFINAKNKEGITALHYSVIKGNFEIFKLLKKFGASLDIVTNAGKNIMHLAAESNQPSMMMYLYLNEAQDISSVDENGSTPLHWACYYKAEECVNYLLHLNVNINAEDKEKFTPLNVAVNNNNANIVRILIRKGANKKIRNQNNQLPLDIAKKKNYTEIINILTRGENHLFTLEMPNKYIKPTDTYKRAILIVLIICEMIIIIFVLPFLESLAFFIINLVFFGLSLLSYFILSLSNPGYQKNKALVAECHGEEDYKCLKKLVEDGEDLKNYCPVCYIKKSNDIIHCYFCNKCIKDISHHCFWFNKCIGRKNKILYIIFLGCTFVHSIYSVFICSNLIFDNVSIPYESIFLTWYFIVDRGIRVLGANIISLFCMFCSYPLFFLFMIEMFKLCGLLGKKDKDKEYLKKEGKIETIKNDVSVIELQEQKHDELLIDKDVEEDDKEDNIIKTSEDNIPNQIEEEKNKNQIIENVNSENEENHQNDENENPQNDENENHQNDENENPQNDENENEQND